MQISLSRGKEGCKLELFLFCFLNNGPHVETCLQAARNHLALQGRDQGMPTIHPQEAGPNDEGHQAQLTALAVTSHIKLRKRRGNTLGLALVCALQQRSQSRPWYSFSTSFSLDSLDSFDFMSMYWDSAVIGTATLLRYKF